MRKKAVAVAPLEMDTVRLVRPSLPPLSEFQSLIKGIWDNRFLTNSGPLHARLEAALSRYLGAPHVSLVSNATLGAIAAMRVLGQVRPSANPHASEVITTPFSFVATSNAIRMAGFEPVFADIDPQSLNLCPEAVERAITPATRAIMAVHAFGVPCDVDALGAIARKYGLPLIYDAAHGFGVRHRGQALATFGDFSVLSFHATKVFNTFEGGAVICPNAASKAAIDKFCNHGIEDAEEIAFAGFNGKLSELHAAAGLAQLPYVDEDIAARGIVARRYADAFAGIAGIRCILSEGVDRHNHYAFPVLVEEGYGLDAAALADAMAEAGIITRRYFHPLISDMSVYRNVPSSDPAGLPVARQVSERVLCLPLYPDLPVEEQERVIDV
ncbi:MAG: DegT/DnrJ/EryC1/StrS family aminotransferase, partial [Pseudomonadota bacterium]